MKKLVKITKSQITEKGVQSLADRPNASAQYGVGGLSPQQLKLWFDKLATFLAEKINEICGTISSDDAADYIRLALDNYEVGSLQDLVNAMLSGDFANKILQVLPSVNSFATVPLQRYINDAAQAISENAEQIEYLWESCGVRLKVSLDTNTYTLTIHLFNEAGEVLSVHSVDMMVNTARIVDYAVTTPKLSDRSVTTPKLSDGSVKTEKIADAAVVTEKIADDAIVTDKIADAAVTTEKIQNASVATEKLSDSAITTEKIKSAAVTGDKIQAGSITEVKLSSGLNNRLLTLENQAFTNIAYDAKTGTLTFTSVDGSTESVDLPLELITSGGYYDDSKGKEAVVLVLSNGEEIRIPVDDMLAELIGYMDGIRQKIYDLQEAPPIAALSNSILLCTPTLAQLAALG